MNAHIALYSCDPFLLSRRSSVLITHEVTNAIRLLVTEIADLVDRIWSITHLKDP